MNDDAILIIDDDDDILTAGRLLLKRHYQTVECCNQPENIPQLMAKQNYDVILLDMNFGPGESSGRQGYAWLERILTINPLAVVVMITAHGDVDTAVEAMKLGATDFIAKPWQNEKVIATLSSAIKLSKTRSEASQLRSTNKVLAQATNQQADQPLLGTSQPMRQVQSLIELTAPTDANVLILGENGTGKELVARALHAHSQRADHIFMAVDLGAVAETLFESELFGHKKGAFTGAKEDRVGRMQAAEGGTLFLDEIGNLPLHLQAKLLTALEQRKVTPVGSNQSTSINVRVVAATNLTRNQLADETRFRQDLLFRLNTVEITLPPLRDRAADIPALAQYYLEHYCKKYHKPSKPIGRDALSTMQHYSWPGNVRALRHAVERAVILSQGDEFTAQDFQLASASQATDSPPSPVPAQGFDFDTQQDSERPHSSSQTDFNLEKLEYQTISSALQTYKYNISHAAKALGITRAALYRRMEKHGL